MSDCIFCKLANGDIPANLIYEDEWVVAFHDLHPQAPVHVLIVPKTHVQNIDMLASHEAGEAILGQILRAIPSVAERVGIRNSTMPRRNAATTATAPSAHSCCGRSPPSRHPRPPR